MRLAALLTKLFVVVRGRKTLVSPGFRPGVHGPEVFADVGM